MANRTDQLGRGETRKNSKAIRQLAEEGDGTLEINGVTVAKILERGSHLRLHQTI